MGNRLVVAFLGPIASYTHQVSISTPGERTPVIQDIRIQQTYGLLESSSHVASYLPSFNKHISRLTTPQATISEFPESQYDIRPQTGIEDVFKAVQARDAARGVVPFENSTNGSVIFTMDLLADLNNDFANIIVEGEIYLRVQHCLLGRTHSKSTGEELQNGFLSRDSISEGSSPSTSGATVTPRVKPAYDLKHVNKLYSHPQAWGQCKKFLNTHLKGVERQDTSSTSKAAETVASDASGTSAAVSSRIAADIFGLDVLAEGIEDNAGNSTRFLILRHRSSPPLFPVPEATSEDDEMKGYKSLVSFTVSHDSPGAMADSLAVFSKHGLNLTNLTSRPSGEAPWHYIFFVEFKGRKRSEGEGGAVNRALQELDKVAQSWRWLGSWANRLPTT